VDRKTALATACTLLENAGHADALVEVRRAFELVESYETQGKALSDVTRTLLESEKTYRLVFSRELEPMALFEPATGRFVEVNESWVKLYGYTRDEMLGMTVHDVSAAPELTEKALREVSSGKVPGLDVRWHRAKDGTVFPVESTTGRIVLEGREVIYAVIRDITQRQDHERALARAQESYHALIDSMPDGVIVGRKGAVVYFSPAMRRMLGYSAGDEVTGIPVLDLVHPDDRERASERIRSIVSCGVTVPPVEERLRRRDGTYVITELMAMRALFEGEPSVLAIVRDVSTRKEMEAQLVLNDRLASLGRLAASVGHELNNPLAYVLGNVSLLERELSRGEALGVDRVERCLRYVRTIAEGASRMRHVVHDLKTLARADVEERVAVDVQHLLDVCANMAEHEVGPRARLHKEYRAKATVRGSEARLGQVFLNLLINAAQAIPPGAPEDNEIRIVLREERSRVVVEIADTGNGIAAADRDRVFEPFFTTKEGTGTGLGLSISHGIVTELGGTISLEPRADRGTIFRVDLPAFEPPPPRQA
jgi:PAS domain S-box-containing protein